MLRTHDFKRRKAEKVRSDEATDMDRHRQNSISFSVSENMALVCGWSFVKHDATSWTVTHLDPLSFVTSASCLAMLGPSILSWSSKRSASTFVQSREVGLLGLGLSVQLQAEADGQSPDSSCSP